MDVWIFGDRHSDPTGLVRERIHAEKPADVSLILQENARRVDPEASIWIYIKNPVLPLARVVMMVWMTIWMWLHRRKAIAASQEAVQQLANEGNVKWEPTDLPLRDRVAAQGWLMTLAGWLVAWLWLGILSNLVAGPSLSMAGYLFLELVTSSAVLYGVFMWHIATPRERRMASDAIAELETGNGPVGLAVGDNHVESVRQRLEEQGYEVETTRRENADF